MVDQPVTDIFVLAEKSRCPPDYKCIEYSEDSNTLIDLWKDGLFSRKTNRYICFTRDPNSANIIEDIKLMNEKDNFPSSFINIDKTKDSNEKTFQKKILLVKFCPRAYASTAICEIVILSNSKKAPRGFTLVGDINGYTLCYKTGPIRPPDAAIVERMKSGSITPREAPPKPNTPFIYPQIQMPKPYGTNGTFVQASDFYRTVSRTYESNYNPLQGIPFEINPIFKKTDGLNQLVSFFYHACSCIKNHSSFRIPHLLTNTQMEKTF